jgi:hypothetical protein
MVGSNIFSTHTLASELLIPYSPVMPVSNFWNRTPSLHKQMRQRC